MNSQSRAENPKGTDALVEAQESVGRVLRVAISSCIRESVEVRILEELSTVFNCSVLTFGVQ
jgi:hypothetical protein